MGYWGSSELRRQTWADIRAARTTAPYVEDGDWPTLEDDRQPYGPLPGYVTSAWIPLLRVVRSLWDRSEAVLSPEEDALCRATETRIKEQNESNPDLRHMSSHDRALHFQFPMAECCFLVRSVKPCFDKWLEFNKTWWAFRGFEREQLGRDLANDLFRRGITLSTRYNLKWQYIANAAKVRALQYAIRDKHTTLRLQAELLNADQLDALRDDTWREPLTQFVTAGRDTSSESLTPELCDAAVAAVQRLIRQLRSKAEALDSVESAEESLSPARLALTTLKWVTETDFDKRNVQAAQQTIWLLFADNNIPLDAEEPITDEEERKAIRSSLEQETILFRQKIGPGVEVEATDKCVGAIETSNHEHMSAEPEWSVGPSLADRSFCNRMIHVTKVGPAYFVIVNCGTDDYPLGLAISASDLGFEDRIERDIWVAAHQDEDLTWTMIEKFIDCVDIHVPTKLGGSPRDRPETLYILKLKSGAIKCVRHHEFAPLCRYGVLDRYRDILRDKHSLRFFALAQVWADEHNALLSSKSVGVERTEETDGRL